MTNYAQICLIFTNCGRIYGQKWPDLWPNEIVGMAMAMVAIPDFTSMCVVAVSGDLPVPQPRNASYSYQRQEDEFHFPS